MISELSDDDKIQILGLLFYMNSEIIDISKKNMCYLGYFTRFSKEKYFNFLLVLNFIYLFHVFSIFKKSSSSKFFKRIFTP